MIGLVFVSIAVLASLHFSEAQPISIQRQTNDIEGLYNPNANFEADTVAALQDCANNGRRSVCDVYFNPHTAFDHYLNPTAYGVARAQLRFDRAIGSKLRFRLQTQATSEIMNRVMRLNPPGAAGAQPYDNCPTSYFDDDGELGACRLPRRTARINGLVVELDIVTNTIVLKSGTRFFLRDFATPLECPSAVDACEDGVTSVSNAEVIGLHLHLGDSNTDGAPVVFFCVQAPLVPGFAASQPSCDDNILVIN